MLQCDTKRCSKFGGADHEWKGCTKHEKCLKCHINHSVTFAGCKIYKEEAKTQVFRAKENISYVEAKHKARENALHNSDSLAECAKPLPKKPRFQPRLRHNLLLLTLHHKTLT